MFTELKRATQHICGLRPDNTAECWGSTNFGDLVPTDDFYDIDTNVIPFDTWEYAAKAYLSCGIRSDDRNIERWSKSPPNPIWDGEPYVGPEGEYADVTTENSSICGLRLDGTVACNTWDRWHGFYADPFPGTTFMSLHGGPNMFCGIRADDSTLECRTDGWSAEQGLDIWPEGPIAQLATGIYHMCALMSDGNIECWGNNKHGKADAPDGQFIAVAAGKYNSCGIRTDGDIECWGWNAYEFLDPKGGMFRDRTE